MNVEDWHTYFVSEHDVFIHNSCKGYDKQKKGTPRNNQAQNKQFRDIVKKLKLNKKSTKIITRRDYRAKLFISRNFIYSERYVLVTIFRSMGI